MNCKFCKKEIKKNKYSLNDGIYCDNCWEIGLIVQNQKDRIYGLREKINNFDWKRPVASKNIY